MSDGIGVAAGMNHQFLFGLLFYLTTIGIGVYFAMFHDFNPNDYILPVIFGAMAGSSSTTLALTIVMKIIKKEEKEMMK